MSMRTIGINVLFVVRTSETFRSIIQIRYASNPGRGGGFDDVLAEMCSPELKALVAIVEAKNAVTQCVISPTRRSLSDNVDEITGAMKIETTDVSLSANLNRPS
jgi:hypothetical protein